MDQKVGRLHIVFFSMQVESLDCLIAGYFTTQSRILITLEKTSFENIMGQGKNAGIPDFLLVLECFLLYKTEF